MNQPPDTPILDRLLEPVSRCLTPEAARQLVALRADPQFQERLDVLADRCTEGLLTPEEREEYETYVRAIHIIAILLSNSWSVQARTTGHAGVSRSIGRPQGDRGLQVGPGEN